MSGLIRSLTLLAMLGMVAVAGSVRGQSQVPPLPEPLASFGAAVADGWLYVYGGHTGQSHDHSAANLSKHFRRLKLSERGAWEELPMKAPLQGLAMVAYGGKVYCVGGLNAHNATTTDEADLHSIADFACYDPVTKEWTELAPLPAPVLRTTRW